jgi:hypothetical protein
MNIDDNDALYIFKLQSANLIPQIPWRIAEFFGIKKTKDYVTE